MYRNAVDQATRDDIAAAAAAHHELGRDYDGAVAESLIDRIGAEIDKRIDVKLGAGSPGSGSPAVRQSGRSQALWTGAGIGAGVGAGLTGLVAMVANGGMSQTVVPSVITVWLILTVA
jgi:hypothetical protein